MGITLCGTCGKLEASCECPKPMALALPISRQPDLADLLIVIAAAVALIMSEK